MRRGGRGGADRRPLRFPPYLARYGPAAFARLPWVEREVLRLLALGHTNQEIAKTLFISVRTAETHRAHIMQKLGLSSRAELVRYALDEGLLEG